MARVRIGARGTGVHRVAAQAMAPAVETWSDREINGGAGAIGGGDGRRSMMVSCSCRSWGAKTTVCVGAPDSSFESLHGLV
jgi:hypothetical protein